MYLKTTTLTEGDIVVDGLLIARNGWSNTIFAVTPSSSALQPNVLGVVALIRGAFTLESFPPSVFTNMIGEEIETMPEWNATLVSTYNLVSINALGEGQMNVIGENGSIAAGDYIVTSSTAGKGMKQVDDVLHNYTVAKARESVTFTSPTEIKIVACIYVCG